MGRPAVAQLLALATVATVAAACSRPVVEVPLDGGGADPDLTSVAVEDLAAAPDLTATVAPDAPIGAGDDPSVTVEMPVVAPQIGGGT